MRALTGLRWASYWRTPERVPSAASRHSASTAPSSISRGRKLLIGALVAYLALPFDLVPDFIPVVGQLDDAIIVAFVLRTVLHGAGPGLVHEHWPGPPASLRVMLRLAAGRED
jgi:uncharacterized membrane protein YkvA (DUF1232 family)